MGFTVLRPFLVRPESVTVMAEIPEGPPLHFTWRRVNRRVIKAEGPERIAPEWWRTFDGSPMQRTRDYYRVEDEDDGIALGQRAVDEAVETFAEGGARLVQPRRVDEDDLSAFPGQNAENPVPRRLRARGGDRHLGTDELIELYLPADDTYTMVVHGWSVPNEPLPFDLYSWEVPLASGGSLSVDSAPTSAEVGQTGTVDISWSGLSSGTTYLGAVSHTGDVGLMGLTLVEQILKQHNASFSLTTNEDQGMTARVTFPRGRQATFS